jgi:hypothetical protein
MRIISASSPFWIQGHSRVSTTSLSRKMQPRDDEEAEQISGAGARRDIEAKRGAQPGYETADEAAGSGEGRNQGRPKDDEQGDGDRQEGDNPCEKRA